MLATCVTNTVAKRRCHHVRAYVSLTSLCSSMALHDRLTFAIVSMLLNSVWSYLHKLDSEL